MPANAIIQAMTVALLTLAGAALLVTVAWNGGSARAGLDRCSTPEEILSLNAPLPRTVAKLRRGKSLTIVALGSSSTAAPRRSTHGATMPRPFDPVDVPPPAEQTGQTLPRLIEVML